MFPEQPQVQDRPPRVSRGLAGRTLEKGHFLVRRSYLRLPFLSRRAYTWWQRPGGQVMEQELTTRSRPCQIPGPSLGETCRVVGRIGHDRNVRRGHSTIRHAHGALDGQAVQVLPHGDRIVEVGSGVPLGQVQDGIAEVEHVGGPLLQGCVQPDFHGTSTGHPDIRRHGQRGLITRLSSPGPA